MFNVSSPVGSSWFTMTIIGLSREALAGPTVKAPPKHTSSSSASPYASPASSISSASSASSMAMSSSLSKSKSIHTTPFFNNSCLLLTTSSSVNNSCLLPTTSSSPRNPSPSDASSEKGSTIVGIIFVEDVLVFWSLLISTKPMLKNI